MFFRYLLILFSLFIFSFGDSILIIKKGWQLIGVSQNIKDISIFNSENVEQIWAFDASTQKWQVYSNDEKIRKKAEERGLKTISEIKNYQGFWIKSKREWVLTIKDNKIDENNITNRTTPNDFIILKKGWNLVSLPIDSTISPKIFKNMVVWKYDNKKWHFFQNSEDKRFSTISHIKNSDGFWVKAEKDTNISISKESPKLTNFQTKEEMESYIKEMLSLYNRPYWGIMPFVDFSTLKTGTLIALDTTSENSQKDEVENATTTNLQEKDVDEADIIKHNGESIFYLFKSNYYNGDIDKIYITTFSHILNGEKKPINQIEFKKGVRVNSLYLYKKNRLVALSNFYQDKENKTIIDIFDVSDIFNIKKVANFSIDGRLKTSRVVEGKLFLITTFYPKVEITYPKIYIDKPECENSYKSSDKILYNKCYYYHKDSNGSFFRYDYDNYRVDIKKLLPTITKEGEEKQDLIKPKNLWTSLKIRQIPNITTLSYFDLDEVEYKKSNSFIGYTNREYASKNSFYLISSQYPFYYDFRNYRERSAIYKFNLDNNLSYRGYGFVNGTPLNQFSLSEYQNILRIATTEGFSWRREGIKNSLFTLKENNKTLAIQGVLSGLGEEGERIKGVRFLQDKAFIVTFRQTDPFYTIDLSNYLKPKKVGELKVNGYSGYLHPVGEDKILGFGRMANENGRVEGLKVELFDISDFKNPISLDSKIIGDKYTHSELEYDHKALAFRSSDNIFAFPYNNYYKKEAYLGVYQIDNNKIKEQLTIKDGTNINNREHRGLIFDFEGKTFVIHFINGSFKLYEL